MSCIKHMTDGACHECKIELLEKELATLKASLPKIKAEAVLEYEIPDMDNDREWIYINDDKNKYANKLEAGELDDCECEELGSICDHCEDDV